MSKVNQLLEKAISTASEEEAISCLRMARKHCKGEPVSVKASNTSEVKNAHYWEEQAHRYFKLAQERDARAIKLARQHTDYLGRYNTALAENKKLKQEANRAKTTGMMYKTLIFALSVTLIMAIIL